MAPGRPLLQHPWPQRLRVLLLACLMIALPLYGSSAATLKLLGPTHRHTPMAAHDDTAVPRHGLLALLLGTRLAHMVGSWQLQLRSAGAASHQAHAHHHTGWQQHHHDAHDASVVTAGAGDHAADAADEAAAGSATLPLALALADGLRLPAAAARRRPWPRQCPASWRSRHKRRLERPPQAH